MATHSSILSGKFCGQRSLVGYSPWGCKESDTTETNTSTSKLIFGVLSKVGNTGFLGDTLTVSTKCFSHESQGNYRDEEVCGLGAPVLTTPSTL